MTVVTHARSRKPAVGSVSTRAAGSAARSVLQQQVQWVECPVPPMGVGLACCCALLKIPLPWRARESAAASALSHSERRVNSAVRRTKPWQFATLVLSHATLAPFPTTHQAPRVPPPLGIFPTFSRDSTTRTKIMAVRPAAVASPSMGATFQIEPCAKKDWHSSIDLNARRSVLLHMCV